MFAEDNVRARRVYHFVSRDYGLDDLRRRRLKIATIGDLNDPFELRAMAFADAEKRRAMVNWRQHLAREVGLLCFSIDWTNPVHWSHYGERHRGLCLGFDVPERFIIPVQYRAKLHPDVVTDATGPGEMRAGAMRALLTTKYSHWRYEKEVRMFLDLTEEQRDGPLYFHPFDKDLRLREVIVGAESTVSRAELSAALGGPAIEVTAVKARLAFRSFRVVRQKKDSMWK